MKSHFFIATIILVLCFLGVLYYKSSYRLSGGQQPSQAVVQKVPEPDVLALLHQENPDVPLEQIKQYQQKINELNVEFHVDGMGSAAGGVTVGGKVPSASTGEGASAKKMVRPTGDIATMKVYAAKVEEIRKEFGIGQNKKEDDIPPPPEALHVPAIQTDSQPAFSPPLVGSSKRGVQPLGGDFEASEQNALKNTTAEHPPLVVQQDPLPPAPPVPDSR